MNKCEEYRERDNVLDDENLVAPASNGRHGAENDPYQGTPGSKALPSDLVVFELVADIVVRRPCTEKPSHVHSRREEHTSSAPSVQPVQTLVTDAAQPSDDVVLASKKEDDGYLCDGDNTASVSDTLAGELVLQI